MANLNDKEPAVLEISGNNEPKSDTETTQTITSNAVRYYIWYSTAIQIGIEQVKLGDLVVEKPLYKGGSRTVWMPSNLSKAELAQRMKSETLCRQWRLRVEGSGCTKPLAFDSFRLP